MCKVGWCIGLVQEGRVLHEGGGELSEIPSKEVEQKRWEGKQRFLKGTWGGWNPITNYEPVMYIYSC